MKAYIYATRDEAAYANIEYERLTFIHGHLPGEDYDSLLCRFRLEAEGYLKLDFRHWMEYTAVAIIKNGVDWARKPHYALRVADVIDGKDHYEFLCNYRAALEGKLEGWKLKYVDVYPGGP